MQRFALLTTAIVLVAAAWIASGTSPTTLARQPAITDATPSALDQSTPTPDSPHFIVHEWGTFTSFSGSDGVRMDFRPLVDNDLPDFVFDPVRQRGQGLFAKPAIRSRQRMETPVTYFYTDRIRQARVKVGFPNGLLTEFYPPVHRLGPEIAPNLKVNAAALPPDLKEGELDWGTVTLLPQSALKPDIDDEQLADAIARQAFSRLPPGGDPEPELYTGDHYYYARDTDSALVHVRLSPGDKNLFRPTGDFFEKFLFYRGVGNFDLPLTMVATDEGQLRISNHGSESLQALFLVRVQGKTITATHLDDLPPGGSITTTLPESAIRTSELAAEISARLTGLGLFKKEADAMVRTWQDSWFKEQGTRLLYVIPRSLTDELLPLTIEPAPQETVRVMVGRLEFLTPADETDLEQLVARHARDRAEYRKRQQQGETGITEPAIPRSLREMGRLAEPALTRIRYLTSDPRISQEARQLIDDLRQAENRG